MNDSTPGARNPLSVRARLESATDQINSGDILSATRILSSICGYPRALPKGSEEEEIAQLLQRVVIQKRPESEALFSSERDPTAASSLFLLGYFLIEVHLFHLAASVLARATERAPGDSKIADEYFIALEELAEYESAREFLEPNTKFRATFGGQYYYVFTLMMLGDIELAKTEYEVLQALHTPASPRASDESYRLEALRGMFYRAERIRPYFPLDRSDVIGWNAVINAIVQLLPPGQNDLMGGRAGWFEEDEQFVAKSLAALKLYLQRIELPIEVVYIPPDLASTILGFALATLLRVPVVSLDSIKTDVRPGVVAIYHLEHSARAWTQGGLSKEDLNSLLKVLRQNLPGVVVWAHGADWRIPSLLSPDVLSYYVMDPIPFWKDLLKEREPTGSNNPEETVATPIKIAEHLAKTAVEVAESELAFLSNIVEFSDFFKDGGDPDGLEVFKEKGQRTRQRVGLPAFLANPRDALS